ncbi:hypothetical protein IG631_22684 [Alternaria alternata]|nr:hypothetical protein IG631_22684 [Alternaria alternata]
MALTGYHMLKGDASDKSVLVADMNMSIQNLLTARGEGLAPSFAMSFTARTTPQAYCKKLSDIPEGDLDVLRLPRGEHSVRCFPDDGQSESNT